MPWDQLVILTCGVAGVVLAQIPATQKYACFAGGAGQIGWFHAVDYSSQPGIWLTCLVYALAWGYGLWLHWLRPLLSSIATRMAGPSTGPGSPRAPVPTTRPRRATLTVVK